MNDKKGKPMSDEKKHQERAEIRPDEVIRHVQLKDIFADYAWNVRSYDDVITNESDGVQDTTGRKTVEGTGLSGLALSLRQKGQDTPVILRNITDGKSIRGQKTEKPYELVSGFRRFTAARSLNEGEHLATAQKNRVPTIANTGDGTILAVVRTMNVAEARLVNARENTQRSNLKTPDLVNLVVELNKGGMSQVQISEELGIGQGYVSKLLAISTLPKVILAHWREGKPVPGLPETVKWKQLTTAELVDLAAVAKGQSEGETVARYVRILSPQALPANGEGEQLQLTDRVLERIQAQAAFLGSLVRAGILEPGSLDWVRIIGPKKAGYLIDSASGDHMRIMALCDAFASAYERAVTAEEKHAPTIPTSAA
jgi:ParB-like chromosome segregation protein Spo0J